MSFVESFLNILFIYLILRGVINIFNLIQLRKKAQQQLENNPEQKQIQEIPTVKEEVELVTDSICGCTIPKPKAFILAKDNEKHYFCSWSCREKYIAMENQSASHL
ncbi:transcriptional regulator [Desulfotomaculum sp. 1211_IL3151]|uniref:transcriptional regulator n=1 Tax=Desulfotomaculum sp. 1211_IL3151 TaxID=3084055 RepID=UPI002FD954EF